MPFIFRLLFKYLINHKHYETVLDDYNEYYQYLKKEDGVIKASFTLSAELVMLIPVNIGNTLYWGGIMFSNYLKVAIRNLFKNKLFSAINIFGLAVGIACCLLIGLWISEEMTQDTYMPDDERVFTIYEKQTYSGGREFFTTSTPGPLAVALKEEFPEVEKSATLLFTFSIPLRKGDTKLDQDNIIFTHKDFFDIYGITFLKGEKEGQFKNPNSIILTKSTAEKYFGKQNPLGETIKYYGTREMKITGIVADPPKNSSMEYSVLLPFEFHNELLGFKIDRWGNNWPGTVVKLKPNVDLADFGSKIEGFIKTKVPESVTDLYIESAHNIYLYGVNNRGGRYTYLLIFSVIAGVVLLIACINFINLATARSSKRAKEIGLRKVVGVTKGQIIRQFIGESYFSVFLATLIGFFLTALILPSFNEIAEKEIAYSQILKPEFLLLTVVMIIITGLISGLYPSFYISSFQPTEVLKGNIKSGRKSVWFRKILVAAQFTISISLIVLTIIISRQINYITNLDLGYDKENLIAVNMQGTTTVNNYPSLRNVLLQHPNVTDMTVSNRRMLYNGNNSSGFDWEGKNPNERFLINFNLTDPHFIEAFKIELLDGKNFKPVFGERTESNNEYIINQAAAKKMGMENPVGKRLDWGDGKGHIIGLMKDFNFSNVRDEIKPLVMANRYKEASQIYIRMTKNDIKNTLAFIEERWNQLNPEAPFTFEFMDDRIGRLYNREEKVSDIINSFSALAIFIACLGLIGMVSYSAEQRTKEVGIRKVLGASVPVIFRLFSKDFMKWILIGGVVSIPLSLFLINKWLENYKYKIEVRADIFIIAILATAVISVLTISFQIIKAANANPVNSLRSE